MASTPQLIKREDRVPFDLFALMLMVFTLGVISGYYYGEGTK